MGRLDDHPGYERLANVQSLGGERQVLAKRKRAR
jgi:hypothetical protein